MDELTLGEVLLNLPEEERAMLKMHYQGGNSPAEIAALLSIPEAVVIRVIAAAKSRLLALFLAQS